MVIDSNRAKEKERSGTRLPSVCHRDQILVVESLAGDMTTELHVTLLRVHVACIEEDRQAEGF